MTVPAYLINLDRSPDRLGEISEQLSALGIAFERVPAVDGRNLSDDDIGAVRVDTPGWLPLSAGEVGCFLSHRTCWRRIAEGEAAYGCVFEDDVLLSAHLPGFLSNADWIPSDADLVKIEDPGIRVWFDANVLNRANGFRLATVRSPNYRAGGYILAKTTARRLLEMTERFAIPVDLLLFDHTRGFATKMTIYQLIPALCAQKKGQSVDDLDTTIDARGRFEREGWLAYQGRRYKQEAWKLWHRLHGRRRMAVGFDQQ